MASSCETAYNHFLSIFLITSWNLSYTTVAPVLPAEIKRRNIQEFYSGLVFR